MSNMKQKWLEVKAKLDHMSDNEFEKMIKRNGHYDIDFAEEILYRKASLNQDDEEVHKYES